MPPNRNPSSRLLLHPVGERRLANCSQRSGPFRTSIAVLPPFAPHSAGEKPRERERRAPQAQPADDCALTHIGTALTRHGIRATRRGITPTIAAGTANARAIKPEHGRANLEHRSSLNRTARGESPTPISRSRTETLGVPNSRAFVENASWRIPNSCPPNPERQPATTERRAPNRERLISLIEPHKPFNHPTHG
jgi:hypothetical protein